MQSTRALCLAGALFWFGVGFGASVPPFLSPLDGYRTSHWLPLVGLGIFAFALAGVFVAVACRLGHEHGWLWAGGVLGGCAGIAFVAAVLVACHRPGIDAGVTSWSQIFRDSNLAFFFKDLPFAAYTLLGTSAVEVLASLAGALAGATGKSDAS